jgi:methylenetetrahydrofolate dehydrogenase (NADP+)/methenyltetrahydrofolate cyclohydrolase
MNILKSTMPIVVDGNRIAKELQEDLAVEVSQLTVTPVFHIIYVGSDPVIDNYLSYKKRFARHIGVEVNLHQYPSSISLNELEEEVQRIASLQQPMIVQLPLPEHLNTQEVLDVVPENLDVDVLSSSGRASFVQGTNTLVPPVVASIVEVFKQYQVSLEGKSIVIVGYGTLVGQPMAAWCDIHNYPYKLITIDTNEEEKAQLLRSADIVISGAGVPGLINKNLVKEGVIIVDAGTSESGRRIRGDVDRGVAEVSQLFTPVPGGIGPLTIALLYRNVVSVYTYDS